MVKRAAVPLIPILLLASALSSKDMFPGRFHRFERLQARSGNGAIIGFSSICQDKEGFLWLGTSAGLARYDGYGFKFLPLSPEAGPALEATGVFPVTIARSGEIWIGTNGQGLIRLAKETDTFLQYRHDPADPASLSDDIVLAVQEDPKGDLWVGTRSHGLNRFDRTTGTFTRISLGPGAEVVWDVLADRRGRIWGCTLDAGMFRIDPATGDMDHFRFAPDDPSSLGSDRVWTVFEDRAGTIWAGTKNGGLNRYDPDGGGFTRFYGAGDLPLDLAGQTITAIAEDRRGRLWLGTASGGLRVWDRTGGDYIVCRTDPQDPESLGDDIITSIFEDAGGVVWVGTVRGGLNKCLSGLAKFEHYKHDASNPSSLGHNDVRAIWADGPGTLWIGTKTGLERIDGRTGKVTRYIPGRPEATGPGGNNILAIRGDSRGGVWLGTEAGGLAHLDPGRGTFTYHRHDPQNPNSLSNNKVYALWADADSPDVLWAGTHQGLNRLETKTGRWTRYYNDPQDAASLSGNIVTAIGEDGTGFLWVGTRWGLNRLDKATGRCETYISRLDDPPGTGLTDNIVNCIHEARDGALWIGTDGGLNRFDRAKGEWRVYAQKDGLWGEVVCGIQEDTGGSLWLSTNRGLSRLDRKTNRITNYGLRDGLQGTAFNPRASFKAADGRMFFGGANGFNGFDPAAIRKDPFIPPVVWTAFYRNNVEVKLPRSLSSLRNLTLPFRSPLVTLEFAALTFAAPEMNSFAYRLEPRDADWIPLVPDHRVSLHGIGAGKHTLHVKAANPDGVWNEAGIAIGIKVQAPFWRSWWFLLIAAALLAFGAGSVVKIRDKIKSSSLAMGKNLDGVIETYDLTSREREILRLVLQGASNKDIERKLFISPSTVRNHIYNIYQKLGGVRNRLELINRISGDARNREEKD